MRNNKGALGIAVALGLCVTAFAPATERHVPSQYPTIQAAVDACVDGDEVIVADGVYTGPGNRDIRLFGKAITVRSVNGAEACIIDPQELGRGFYLIHDETNDSVIDGFTIRHGGAPGLNGGGIFCHRGATIRNCVISENTAEYGGGVWFDVSDVTPVVEYCTIVSNTANYNGGGVYGGVAIIRDSVIANNIAIGIAGYDSGLGGGAFGGKLERCTVVGNSANWGGGIAQHEIGGGNQMVNCAVTANHATYGGGGLYGRTGRLANCLVAGNSSDWYGGGFYGGFDSYNCTVADNSAAWYGGGVYCFNRNWNAFNSIIAGNAATYGAEIALDDDSRLVTQYSDLLGGDGWLWVGGGSFVVWGDGNIDVDPAFADPLTGDYRLQLDSPCVDTGSNQQLDNDWADLDGDGDPYEPVPYDLDDHPRVARFTVDMGAYEVPFGDLNCDSRIDFGDINPFVLVLSNASAWQAAYPGCELLYADINGDGVVGFGDINPFVMVLSGP